MIKPPSEILRALKSGEVGVWNKWKREQISGADLVGANLWGADLVGANLWGADLVGANLWGADLVGANLWGANLERANLTGANLTGAILRGAELAGAELAGTGVISKEFAGFWCIVTPDYAWLGCEEGIHEYWESLSKEEALALDEDAPLLWPHRDELLGLMKQAREAGWPLLSDK